MTGPCPRESAVVSAGNENRWPDQCGHDLEAHVAECHDCRDAVEVCGVLREADVPTVPAAGRVWLRAAVRLRADAECHANRSLTWALGVGGACIAGLGLSALSALRPTLDWLMTRAATSIARLAPRAEEATEVMVRTLLGSVPFALTIVAGLILTPLVLSFVFLALSRSAFRSSPRHNTFP